MSAVPKEFTVKLFLALVLAVATSTTVRADPPKDGGSEVAKADADKFLAFFDKLADMVVADKADCTKMAGDVNKHIDANADLIKKGQEAKAKGQKLPKAAMDHMMETTKKMAGALQEKCMNDKGVQTAMERMRIK
jgi:hypothetical protein